MSVQIYKGDILLSEPEVATTQWEKARGLMFRKQHDVLFHFNEEKKLKFHMVFVFYPIDIVFLDHELRVVDLKPKFKPFTFYYSKASSSTVLETYAGFIRDRSIKIGDTLSIVHSGEIDRPSDQAPIPPAQREKVFQGTSLGRTREARVEQVSKSTDPPRPKPKSAKPKATKRAPKKSASKAAKTSKTAKPKSAKKSPKTAKTSKKSAAKSVKKSAKPRSKAPAKRSSASSKTKKTAAKSSKSTKPKAAKSAKPKATKRSTKKSAPKPAKKPANSSAKPKKTTKKSAKK